MRSSIPAIHRRISSFHRDHPEKCAAACAGMVSLAVYAFTKAPTVTLELSGSLVTAADYMGVANSPGYPSWTLAAWLAQWLFGFVRYMGYPNPAWGVAMLSVVAAAGTAATVAWLVARWCRMSMPDTRQGQLDFPDICWVAGTASGLVFALVRTVWSQAVIAETHALNALVISLLLACLFKWQESGVSRHLYAAAFLAGMSLTTSYTSVFLLPAVLVFVVPRGWRRMGGVLACFALGLAFIFYMPVASGQNPPINWGNAHTPEGFLHMLRRGQYEAPVLPDLLGEPARFAGLVHAYLGELAGQFTWPIAGLAVFGIVWPGARAPRSWTVLIVLGWLLMGPGLLTLLQPADDVQTRFLMRVHFIPAYLFHALLVGKGLGVLLDRLTRTGPVRAAQPA